MTTTKQTIQGFIEEIAGWDVGQLTKAHEVCEHSAHNAPDPLQRCLYTQLCLVIHFARQTKVLRERGSE